MPDKTSKSEQQQQGSEPEQKTAPAPVTITASSNAALATQQPEVEHLPGMYLIAEVLPGGGEGAAFNVSSASYNRTFKGHTRFTLKKSPNQ